MEFYNNSQYKRSIENKKTLVLDVTISSADLTFDKELIEPLKIDAVTDIYLDSFTTFNCLQSNNTNQAGFLLNINEFNSNVSTNNPKLSNSIFIPNEQSSSTLDVAKTHKGKKLNYVGYLHPQNIHTLTGTITGLSGATMDSGGNDFRFIAEFILITRE